MTQYQVKVVPKTDEQHGWFFVTVNARDPMHANTLTWMMLPWEKWMSYKVASHKAMS